MVDRANAGEFGVRFHEYASAQTSTMYAATHARGGSNSLLWISEWDYVQATDLRRSEETLTGAIPSAKNGTIVVETTWRGGNGGHLEEMITENKLVVYEAIVLAIDQCYKVDEAKDWRDKALALEAYARKACNTQAEWKPQRFVFGPSGKPVNCSGRSTRVKEGAPNV